MLALVLGSRPASASKKGARHKTAASEASEKSSAESGDDEGDGEPARPKKPAKKASEKAAPRAPVSSSGSGLPEWREGTGWTVKSVYRKLPVRGAAEPEWSEPTYWSFHVKKVKAQGAVKQYYVQVRATDGSRAALASLYFARYPVGGVDGLALTKGRFYTLAAGQVKPPIKPYVPLGAPPHPVIADDSPIPYDFPSLPFQARAPAGTKETALSRTFAVSNEAGGGGKPSARDITQLEHQNATLEAFAGKELVEYIKGKEWTSPDLALVELRRKSDSLAVKQVWSPKLPWYLYSESPTMRSWLWELEAPPPAPAASPAPSAAPASPATPAPPTSSSPSPER